jgi:ribonuclease-3
LRSSKRQPIEKALGIRFGGEELYVWAFTHRSFAYENGGLPTNERLEFLGDAVLGLVVTDIIYRAFPDLPEGHLAKLRAATVNMNVLAEVARELGVGDAVRLGRAGGTSPPSWPTPSRRCSGPSTWTRACRGRPPWCAGCSSTG